MVTKKKRKEQKIERKSQIAVTIRHNKMSRARVCVCVKECESGGNNQKEGRRMDYLEISFNSGSRCKALRIIFLVFSFVFLFFSFLISVVSCVLSFLFGN